MTILQNQLIPYKILLKINESIRTYLIEYIKAAPNGAPYPPALLGQITRAYLQYHCEPLPSGLASGMGLFKRQHCVLNQHIQLFYECVILDIDQSHSPTNSILVQSGERVIDGSYTSDEREDPKI